MKVKICDVNPAAVEKLPRLTDDKSGIGVHYVDAYLKPMNVQLADGTFVKCKRRGLKIALAIGSQQGRGPDAAARREHRSRRDARRGACRKRRAAAGVELAVEDGGLYVTLADAANG